MDVLAIRHKVSPTIQLLLIGLGKFLTKRSKGMIALSAKFLYCSLMLPFSDVLQMLLPYIRLASRQLNPNVWLALAEYHILRERGVHTFLIWGIPVLLSVKAPS